MRLQQYLLNHYLRIPFEEFSHKVVVAHGILVTMRNNPNSQLVAEESKKVEDAIKEIETIIETTDDKTFVSLYVLDRNIAPQDFSKNAVDFKLKFKRTKPYKGDAYIQLNADQVQELLCRAMMKVNAILMERISGFSEDVFIGEGGF